MTLQSITHQVEHWRQQHEEHGCNEALQRRLNRRGAAPSDLLLDSRPNPMPSPGLWAKRGLQRQRQHVIKACARLQLLLQ